MAEVVAVALNVLLGSAVVFLLWALRARRSLMDVGVLPTVYPALVAYADSREAARAGLKLLLSTRRFERASPVGVVANTILAESQIVGVLETLSLEWEGVPEVEQCVRRVRELINEQWKLIAVCRRMHKGSDAMIVVAAEGVVDQLHVLSEQIAEVSTRMGEALTS